MVGASDVASSLGGAPLRLLDRFGYLGEVYPVNRGRDVINGRKCYRSIDDLPLGVDAAILAIPKSAIRDAVGAAGRRNIGGVIVFSSGYAELDETGGEDQRSLAEFAFTHDIALAGPNCLGLINFADGIPLTFGDALPNRRPGRPGVSIVAQSGAMSLALTYAAMAQDINVNYTISTGNEAVLGVEDYLGVILEEPSTTVVAILIEQIRRPGQFLDLARTARERGVALCVLHLGRGERARAASLSHTGALAGDQDILRAVLGREGVLFIDSLDELIDTVDVLTKRRLPSAKGVGLLTDSGAMKTHSLDIADSIGLSLPVLRSFTRAQLASELPPFAIAENPVDITAMGLNDPSLYARVARVLLDDDEVGGVVAAVMPGSPEQGAEQIDALLPVLSAAIKPVIYAIMGGDSPIPDTNRERILSANVPLIRSPERALRAMLNVTKLAQVNEDSGPEPDHLAFISLSVPANATMSERDAKRLLADIGLRAPSGRMATSEVEVRDAASQIGYPVFLKVSSPHIVHKSDVGGVTFVAREEEIEEQYRQMLLRVSKAQPHATLEGVLVERAELDGVEMIVSARRDPSWGTFLLIGSGGTQVEAMNDVAILGAEANRREIREAISQLRIYNALMGARGRQPRDVDALIDAATILSDAMRSAESISEIEVNPLLVLPAGHGVIALDAVIVTGTA